MDNMKTFAHISYSKLSLLAGKVSLFDIERY